MSTLSSSKKAIIVVVVVLMPVVLLGNSCAQVGNFDAVFIEGEHVDVHPSEYNANALELLCFITQFPSNNCWPSNMVWWHETWYKKYWINGQWEWRYNGGGWVYRTCKVRYEAKALGGGEPHDGPCYNVNGVQVEVPGP